LFGDVLNGIAFGSILFILASGFSLALGVIRIVNIAHGAFYMLGFYVALSTLRGTDSFLLAVVAASLAIMVLAAFLQVVFLKRLHDRPLPQVLLTFGVTLVIAEVAQLVWGGYPQVLDPPGVFAGSVDLGSLTFPEYRLFLIAVAVVLAVVLWLGIERTRVGAVVRASVDDQEMARSMGVNIQRVFMLTFAVAGLLAGLGGALGGPVLGAYQGVQFETLTLTLVVVVLGGVGNVGGAFAGSMLVGVINSVGNVHFPELSYFLLFAPMILMLSVRPTGLFGKGITQK
jgi:branched-chain amino acid transport system permease protein